MTRLTRGIDGAHFKRDEKVLAYPYPSLVPNELLPHGGRPWSFIVAGTANRDHPGGGRGVVCVSPRSGELVLAHSFDLYHENIGCATCRRDLSALRALDADLSRGQSMCELAEMMFLALLDGVLVHAIDLTG